MVQNFSNLVKKSIYFLLNDRYKIYGYFDISYLLNVNKDVIMSKLISIGLNKTDFYSIIFKNSKKPNNNTDLKTKINYLLKIDNCKNEFLELVLIFTFKNIKELYKMKQLKLNYSGLFPFNTEIEVLRAYFDNSLDNVKNTNIYYDRVRILPKCVISLKGFLDIPFKNCYFRGHSKINYNLLPTIYREEDRKENHYFNNTIKECPDIFFNKANIDKLSIMHIMVYIHDC